MVRNNRHHRSSQYLHKHDVSKTNITYCNYLIRDHFAPTVNYSIFVEAPQTMEVEQRSSATTVNRPGLPFAAER